jgi:nicotinamidase-related amidase
MNRPAVLVVVDVQNGFLDEYWGDSNNPECENNIRALLAHWRAREWPIVLVKHNSESPTSPLRPGQPGNDLQPGIDGAHDLLVTKTVNSAFYGEPDLHGWLSARGHTSLVICGITTNFCCETTARMAGNLGYAVEFVIDATRTFDHPDADGVMIPADDMSRVTAANLNGEFATIVNAQQVIDASA